MSKQGIVKIHNKEYKTVALRISEFRAGHSIDDGWGVICNVLQCTSEQVLVSAEITAPNGTVVAKDFAQEVWQGKINVTSAVENACTSAIGRCLAAAGLGGENYCSADEVQNAIAQQQAGHTNQPPAATPAPAGNTVPVATPAVVAEPRVDVVPTAEAVAVPSTSATWDANGWASFFGALDDATVFVSTLESIRQDASLKTEVAAYTVALKAAAARGRKLLDKRTTLYKQFVSILTEEKAYVDSRSA